MLLIACCFTLCVVGLCLTGTALLPNKSYVASGIRRYDSGSNGVFRPGPYSTYSMKDGALHGPYHLTLAFYPTSGHIVFGKGEDEMGRYSVKGVYSPTTRRMGLEKYYQTGPTESDRNSRPKVTIQVQWNGSASGFEGKYYLKHGKQHAEQKYIIRPRHSSNSSHIQPVFPVLRSHY